jgi:hypothetical protein
MSMAAFRDTFRRAIGMMPDVLSKPFMEAATGGFGAVFENETPKEPYIIYYRDITEDEKNMLLKNKHFNETIEYAKTNRMPTLFVGKGISTSEQIARNIADTTARSTQVHANPGTATLTGTQTLASVTQYSEKDKKYRIYSIMSGSRNANQNTVSETQPKQLASNAEEKPQVAQDNNLVANTNTQGDQKESVSGQTDAAPVAQANPTPLNPSPPASNPQTAPAAPNVAVNQTQATPATQTTPKPAQTQAPRQIPQAINNIAQRVGAQARTNKQGFPVIRKGNLLTTFNTRDKWVSFYDLTKKQRVASFRYADDNALAQRANATVKSINDLSRVSG